MPKDEITRYTAQFEALCKALRLNLEAALSVGGPQRDNKQSGKLRNSDIFRQTGIARSTLQAIRSNDKNHLPNPDLKTLNRLADLLGVPVAFLLMTPEDWELLLKAVNDFPVSTKAAAGILGDQFGNHATVKQVLTRQNLHPISPPRCASPNPDAREKLNQLNEERRRVSHVMGALMLRQSNGNAHHSQHVALVGLAASITNQIRQHKRTALS